MCSDLDSTAGSNWMPCPPAAPLRSFTYRSSNLWRLGRLIDCPRLPTSMGIPRRLAVSATSRATRMLSSTGDQLDQRPMNADLHRVRVCGDVPNRVRLRLPTTRYVVRAISSSSANGTEDYVHGRITLVSTASGWRRDGKGC